MRENDRDSLSSTEQSRFDCRQDLFYERETNRAGIFTAKGRRGYTSTYFYLRRAFQNFVEKFSREVDMVNPEGRQISIHLADGELQKEKMELDTRKHPSM